MKVRAELSEAFDCIDNECGGSIRKLDKPLLRLQSHIVSRRESLLQLLFNEFLSRPRCLVKNRLPVHRYLAESIR